MSIGHCAIIQKSNRLYITHAVPSYKLQLLFVSGVNNQNIFLLSKLIGMIEIEQLVHKTFLDARISFLTNIPRNTCLFTKLDSLLPVTPSIIEDLSFEQLDVARKKFWDLLIGEKLKFDSLIHQRKVIQNLESDEISPNLTPYLYLLYYARIKPVNWLREFSRQ